jgi:hypothetical protein
VDALGNPTGFSLSPGQAHDLEGADALLPDLVAGALIADKAFDAEERVLKPLEQAGKAAVIPPKGNRKTPRPLRQGPLPGTPPDRELLRQAQAVPGHCHAVRQAGGALPRRHPPRGQHHLAQLRTGPKSLRLARKFEPAAL